MSVSEEQLWNADRPMVFSVFGRIIFDIEEHWEKALSPMLVAFVMTTVLSEEGRFLLSSYMLWLKKKPSFTPSKLLGGVSPKKGTVMLVRALQPANMPRPILVTVLGITTLVSEEQSENA